MIPSSIPKASIPTFRNTKTPLPISGKERSDTVYTVRNGLDELQNCHLSSVATTCADLDDASVAAVAENALHQQAAAPVMGDLFTYWETLPEGELDLIVSNPPYLTAAEMQNLQPEVAQEPAMALEAGEDGLVFYRAIAEHYQKALKSGGALALEIGWQQREAVTALLNENGWVDIVCKKDFGGNDRCILARKS